MDSKLPDSESFGDGRWARLEPLLDVWIDADGDAARQALLDSVHENDPALFRELEEMLRLLATDGDILEDPLAEAACDLLSALARDAETTSDSTRRGQLLGPYRLLEVLDRGGMGVVYVGERADDQFEKRVAVKLLPAGLESRETERRFLTERQILANLEHPNIARLLDGGVTDEGSPYLVMELVDGLPIDRYCGQRKLGLEQRIELFIQGCRAVQFAHQHMVIHRDLKPSNILVTPDGEVKLLDFGIAKLEDPAFAARGDTTVFQPRSVRYASPEQIAHQSVSAASDVYSLGVVLYELLVGRPPYELENLSPSEIEVRVRERTPAAPSTRAAAWRRRLSGDLDNIILKALRKDPTRRYGSAADLAEDLRRFLEGRPVRARPNTRLYRISKFAQRKPWAMAAAATLVAFLAIYLTTVFRHSEQLEAERNAARLEADRALEVKDFLVDLFASADPFAPVDPGRGREITVVEALDLGVDRLGTSLEGQPAIRASLLSAIGSAYQKLGEPERALPLATEALEVQRTLSGLTSRVTRDSLDLLARTHDSLGDYEAAGELHRERLDLVLAADPVDPAEVADAHLQLGRHLLRIPMRQPAEKQLLAAAELAERAELAGVQIEALFLLSEAQTDLGRPAESELSARRALALAEETHGPSSTVSALARSQLARTLSGQGRAEEAEAEFVLAVEALEQALGREHERYLSTLNNLAVLWLNSGAPEKAAEAFAELIEIGTRVRGPDHIEVGRFLQNYATALVWTHRTDESVPLYERASAIFRNSLAADNYQRALPLLSLASIYLDQGRPAEAEETSREALELLSIVLPEGHAITAVAQCRLARSLAARGRTTEALPHFNLAATVLTDEKGLLKYRTECLSAAAASFASLGDEGRAEVLRALVRDAEQPLEP